MNRVETIEAVFQVDTSELAELFGTTPKTLLSGSHGRQRDLWRRVKVTYQIARLALSHIETTDAPRWVRTPLPAMDGKTALEAIHDGNEQAVHDGLADALVW